MREESEYSAGRSVRPPGPDALDHVGEPDPAADRPVEPQRDVDAALHAGLVMADEPVEPVRVAEGQGTGRPVHLEERGLRPDDVERRDHARDGARRELERADHAGRHL